LPCFRNCETMASIAAMFAHQPACSYNTYKTNNRTYRGGS
jgi:hypothetical protein